MILNINGRNMQITDSIRAHVEKKAAKLERFFRPDTEVQVRISQERGGRNIAEVTVALRGVILRAEEVTNDMYASIDTAIDKMVRQIRRHRTKLEKGLRAGAFEPAAAEEVVPEDEVEETAPQLVRVKRFLVKPMDVEDAIAQMEMLGHNFFLFLNIDTESACVVYKRQDGGYGLLICGIAAAMMIKNRKEKQAIAPIAWLLLLFGGMTLVWGTITCSWFGLAAEELPEWLKRMSVPVISNVYSDKIWYPFWTGGKAGLTTSQNVQILMFTIALVHLLIAHASGAARNRGSLKMLGDIGSILELVGMYYVVLSLVVNGAVFGLDLVVSGIPVGTIAVALVIIGFAVNFIFGNYEESILQSVLDSVKDIVSMLLGVVNVFSDIVSYIRLWAVGLAGAAISATINDMVSPLLGHFIFIIFAVIILVFGHGLNMILNVLSVIVHGIRLNTLEFSTHVGLSWSGHKYEPFEE